MMRINPLTLKKIKRFRSIKRGFYSLLILCVLVLASLVAEGLVSNRALVVHYNGQYHFPTYGDMIPGKVFGLGYDYETNYRDLKTSFNETGSANFVIMPLVPYGPYETIFIEGQYPPYPPSMAQKHYLGTDSAGRDIVARLFYGFRVSILFSLFLLTCTYVVGVSLGCVMGYYGGSFDLLFQRLIEIWTHVPFLYVVMIVASIIVPSFWTLVLIMVFFGWMSMTWYMRTAVYKEREREYVTAARALGASNARIIFHHVLPNAVAVIVTFIPFSVSSGIVALTSLDYLGYGLPAPTPSWGELLSQGTTHLSAQWILASVVVSMIVVLTMVTFVGEAVREALDPKKHTVYE